MPVVIWIVLFRLLSCMSSFSFRFLASFRFLLSAKSLSFSTEFLFIINYTWGVCSYWSSSPNVSSLLFCSYEFLLLPIIAGIRLQQETTELCSFESLLWSWWSWGWWEDMLPTLSMANRLDSNRLDSNWLDCWLDSSLYCSPPPYFTYWPPIWVDCCLILLWCLVEALIDLIMNDESSFSDDTDKPTPPEPLFLLRLFLIVCMLLWRFIALGEIITVGKVSVLC